MKRGLKMNLRNVFLLYRTKFDEKPSMCFMREVDAQAVCDAINRDYNSSEIGDMWHAHVEPMPMIGAWDYAN